MSRGVWKQAEPGTSGRTCPLQRTVRNDVMHRPRMGRRLVLVEQIGNRCVELLSGLLR